MLYSSWTDIFSSKKEHSVKIIACFTIHCAVSKGRFQKYSNHLKNLSERIKKKLKKLTEFSTYVKISKWVLHSCSYTKMTKWDRLYLLDFLRSSFNPTLYGGALDKRPPPCKYPDISEPVQGRVNL